MADTVPDDIFALCSRFNLDLDSYRIFPRAKPVRAEAVLPPAPAATVATPVNLWESEPVEEVASTPEGPQTFANDENPPAYALGRFTLRNLWTHVGLAASRRPSRSLSDLLRSSVLITGTTGGAGTTTITATLARLLSQKHQRCGVITKEDNAVLPCYFGDGSLLHGRQSSLSVASGLNAPIRILGRRDIEQELSMGDTSYAIDQILIDLENGFDVRAVTHFLGASAVVIAAVPDVNSVIRARQLKTLFADRAPETPVLCVLNKFDSSQPLHCEIRNWFAETFSSLATLCRSELVNEALAEGMTVTDWFPRSELAQEYSQLLTILQEMLQFQASPAAVTAC